jgi:hypothetical protein
LPIDATHTGDSGISADKVPIDFGSGVGRAAFEHPRTIGLSGSQAKTPARTAPFASPTSPCNRRCTVYSRSSTVTLKYQSSSPSGHAFAGNPQ